MEAVINEGRGWGPLVISHLCGWQLRREGQPARGQVVSGVVVAERHHSREAACEKHPAQDEGLKWFR